MDIKIDQKILTDEEKLQLRKQRFNSGANINTIECIKVKKFVFNFNIQLVEEEKKKILERQKKFGVIVQLPEIEEEKIKIRKERFGIVDGKVIKIFYMFFQDEDEKLKKRAERFNITSESDILKKRAERFGMVPNEELLKKRAERFKNELRCHYFPKNDEIKRCFLVKFIYLLN